MAKHTIAIILGLLLINSWVTTKAQDGINPSFPSQQQSQSSLWLSTVMKDWPPPSSISRYVATANLIDSNLLYNLGCNRGLNTLANQDIIVILDFGYPNFDSNSNKYGVKLLNPPYPFFLRRKLLMHLKVS